MNPLAARVETEAPGRELLLAIGREPKCPNCHTYGFDDWHRDRSMKCGIGIVAMRGRLKCHGCGKFFAIDKYTDGECHMTMWRRRQAEHNDA